MSEGAERRTKWISLGGEHERIDADDDRWKDLEAPGFDPRQLGLIIGGALVALAGGLIIWRVLSRRR